MFLFSEEYNLINIHINVRVRGYKSQFEDQSEK